MRQGVSVLHPARAQGRADRLEKREERVKMEGENRGRRVGIEDEREASWWAGKRARSACDTG